MQLGKHCKLLYYIIVSLRSIFDLGQQQHIDQPSKEEQEVKRVSIKPSVNKVGQLVYLHC